ncbi:MAG: SIS domain-containing protein [archaeon]|nr:SIS domain-containing protein [archaeon]
MNTLEYLTRSCTEALAGISEDQKTILTDLIVSKKRIFVFGVGRSGLVGQTFAIRLVQLGLKVYFVGDMTTPILEKDDLMILISNTGKTMSVVKTAEISRHLGVHVVSVTAHKSSNLAKNSDTVIIVKPKSDEKASIYAPLGTIFEDATLLFFDTLVPELMRKMESTETDMRNKHAIWV